MAMEADHVRYVRRHHPQAAGRTATLIRLCATMSSGPQPFAERMAACGFGEVELGDDEDVADPAGGDEGVYLVCARQLWELTGEFIALL
jgi:protein-tyrosine-phosphatase